MKNRNIFFFIIAGVVLIAIFQTTSKAAERNDETGGSSRRVDAERPDRSANGNILVEIYLSPEQKGETEAVKKAFEALSITKVRPQLFRKGHPPQNIGFGKEIPAEVAREAIRLAMTYNGGIQYFLPEKRLAPNYIGIGVSIFDEAFQVPAGADDLKRLSDPSLTTAQFHLLYDRLTDQPPRIKR